MPHAQRLQQFNALLRESDLDAAALVPGATLTYLTGSAHHLNERPLLLLLPREGQPVAVMPNLEADLFRSQGFDAELVEWHDAGGYDHAFEVALDKLKLDGKRIGVEGQRMRFFEAEALRRHAPNTHIVSADKLLSRVRLHKDAEALAALRRAIQISEQALEATLAQVRVGMTERDIANILLREMNAAGSEGVAFGPLVLAGEMSARPHGMVRDNYHLQPGDPLLIDFGATYHGYNADITRTFFVQTVSDEHRAIYEAVQQANAHGREITRPGLSADALDTASLQVLKDAGYTDLIVHKTGHGLGMEVHEEPYIMQGNPLLLEPGMVFTVEPGLYREGEIGVRIEDNVVVTADGAESLTSFPRELRLVG